ncbi:sensor histidine kinase [Spirosoma pulveris]
MSLLSQTARYLISTAFAIALVGSVGFYTLIHRKIRHEVDEILMTQVNQTIHKLRHQPTSTLTDYDNNPRIYRVNTPLKPTFTDITVPDSLNHNEPIPIRQLQQTVLIQKQLYLITIQQPYYEFNELSREISVGVIVGFLLLMGLSVTIGVGLSSRLWHPFYATINQLGAVRLDTGSEPVFPDSNIREFGLLNRSLRELTQKLRRQFSLQKQFTENASHELQTPLAVASAELDFLLQSDHLTEADYHHLQRATDALGRLSQLTRSLLLLAQVENNQFNNDESVDMSKLLTQCADEYEPFFEHRQLVVERAIAPAITLHMNRQLARVLLTNLLKNAVRHSGGTDAKRKSVVRIELTTHSLNITNTGETLPFPEHQLFDRFVKNPTRPDSTGLGLALVKQICDRYGLPLAYTYDKDRREHSFRIELPIR